jgi:hypothetical protein
VLLDLSLLIEMHPLLPPTTSAEYVYRAALALQRSDHTPGTELLMALDGQTGEQRIMLEWHPARLADAAQIDRHRITEDAAEAVALGLAHVVQSWRVVRRLQRGEAADWLLEDIEGGLVAFEISGIDGPQQAQRIKEKLAQVRIASVALRSACIVAFGPPAAVLAMELG